jgi:hypothetical protein
MLLFKTSGYVMKKILSVLLLLLSLSIGVATAQDDILHVDATQDLGPISPYVYGANTGFSIIPPDLMPQVQAIGIKFLRLGGGLSDQQNIDDITIDLHVLQARQMGAEPLITVRLLDGSPEKAAAAVRHANVDKKYNVKYWSIGNEPNFFVAVMGAASYTADDLTQQWRAIAEAMLAVDPTITLVGPDISQYVPLSVEPDKLQYVEGNLGGDPTDDAGKDWLREFLRVNGDLVGIVSIHRYPYPGLSGKRAATSTIEGLRENITEWETTIPNLRKIIQETTGRDIPIAITEVNSNSTPSSGGEAGLDSLFNAIWMGDVLGRLIRQQVEMVSYWALRSQGNGFGLLGQSDLRPTYYTYLMYTHFGTELVPTEFSESGVSIYAAKKDDGTLTLMVVNLGDDEAMRTLQLDGFTPGGDAEAWRLDADHMAEQIDPVAITDGGTITVPGHSMTLYSVKAAS